MDNFSAYYEAAGYDPNPPVAIKYRILLELYFSKFGHTFSSFGVNDPEPVVPLLEKALKGIAEGRDREELVITDNDLNIYVPPDAVM